MSTEEIEHENPDEETEEPIHGPDDEPEPGQTPAEAAEAEGSSEIAAKLKTATQSYHTRIANLLGREMEEKICPTCDGFGFYDGPAPVAQTEGLPADFVHPENYVACAFCNGYGEVESGSKNPMHAVVTCTRCSGMGYTIETPQAYSAPVVPITQPQTPHPQMGTMMPDGRFVPFGSDTGAPAQA